MNYSENQRAKTPFNLKPKIAKGNKRPGCSIPINFHSWWGEKLTKSQKLFKVPYFAAWRHVQIIHARAKAWVYQWLLHSFYRPRPYQHDITITITITITIFVFLSPGSLTLNPWLSELDFKVHRSSCFPSCWRKEKFLTRKVWGHCTP